MHGIRGLVQFLSLNLYYEPMCEGKLLWEGIKGTISDCDRDPPCPDVGDALT